MIILAKFIGVMIVTMGIVIAVNPKIFKFIMNFWRQGKNVYIAGTVRLIFGSIFLSVFSECRLPAVVFTLGVLMIIGGVIIFLIGPKRIQPVFDWWGKKPPMIMRFMGLVALSIGALLLYSV